MRALDLFIIALYMGGLVGIGLYFARRQTTTENYFIAKRSIPGWATGLSLLATIITSVTFIAYPGSSYAGDWSLLVPGIMFVGVLALVGMIVVPFFRHVVHMSAYEISVADLAMASVSTPHLRLWSDTFRRWVLSFIFSL